MAESISEELALSPLKYNDVKNLKLSSSSNPASSKNKSRQTSLESNDPRYQVESYTIIKQSEFEFPLQFRELKSQTDLKDPPSYWLHGMTSLRFPTMTPKHDDFSSFFMAHQFLDCIGEVDVISDAQNIKKLLKIPYNCKDHVSMIIHRVGKTLLIDEFDIYKYLLRQSEEEWKWLKDFFFDHIVHSFTEKQENILVRPNKSRDAVESRKLLSKFLYHSIEGKEASLQQAKTVESTNTSRSNSTKDVMPDPPPEEHLPQSTVESFTRNIVWNFEDLQMLIGTDLPIFGGRTHPCVSLRLRDMNKPINILTGIDYWLDNLMSNVPEVVMCYHLDGIVQKYELIKTEDLPHLTDSHFSPELIRHIAHNILSFLKTKATKEGHTYWLFKGKDDDIVKLYDLTSLCTEEAELTKAETDTKLPFTIPVALLFYRVANNLWHSECSSSHATIRALLQNSLMLLNPANQCEVFCSAHYILSDLYIPQGINPDSPHASDLSDEESLWDVDEGKDSSKTKRKPITKKEEHKKKKGKKKNVQNTTNTIPSIKVSSLCVPHKSRPASCTNSNAPLENNLSQRCEKSLQHVITALEQLQAPPEESDSTTYSPQKDLKEPKMAKPFEPIPMPYSPIKDSSKLNTQTTCDKSSPEDDKTTKNSNFEENKLSISVLSTQYNVSSWTDKLKVLLLRKASLIFVVRARIQFNEKKYGLTLYYIKMVLHCWRGMSHFLGVNPEQIPLPYQAYSLAGDAYYLISKSWEVSADHIEGFNSMSMHHTHFLNILENILPNQDFLCLMKIPCDVEEAMSLSLNAFQIALTELGANRKDVNLIRRIASISNELGVLRMNQAAELCHELEEGFKCASTLFKESASYLDKSLEMFDEVKDYINVALLYNNIGRLYRLCAFYCIPKTDKHSFTMQEKNYYYKSLKQYKKAFNLFESFGEDQTDIKDLILWEYSTTMFNMATLMANDPSYSEMTLPEEVIKLLDSSLKCCNLNTDGSRLPAFQSRAALIYSRLASIYHNAFKAGKDRNKMKQLAEFNYSRACMLFILRENTSGILSLHLDHISFREDCFKGMETDQYLNSLISILEILMNCQYSLKQKFSCTSKKLKAQKRKVKNPSEPSKSEDQEQEEKMHELLIRYEKKLQTTLFSLMKILKSKAKSEAAVSLVKQMYSSSLNREMTDIETHLVASTSFIKESLDSAKQAIKKL